MYFVGFRVLPFLRPWRCRRYRFFLDNHYCRCLRPYKAKGKEKDSKGGEWKPLSVSNRTEKGDETSKNGGVSDGTSQRPVSCMEFGEDKISINERRKKLSSPRKEKERKLENLLTLGQVMVDESEYIGQVSIYIHEQSPLTCPNLIKSISKNKDLLFTRSLSTIIWIRKSSRLNSPGNQCYI